MELIRGIGKKGSLKAAGMRQPEGQFHHMPHMFHVPVEQISNMESSQGAGGGVGPPLSNF